MTRIDPTYPRSPRTGLLSAVPTGVPADMHVFADGAAWAPIGVPAAGSTVVVCGSTADRAAPTNPDARAAGPLVAWSAYACATIGVPDDERDARASARLEAGLSAAIAGEWASGTVGAGVSGSPLTLAENVDVVTLTAGTVAAGFRAVDGVLTRRLGNVGGLIAVVPEVLDVIRSANLVDRAGDQWVSPNGNLVVADGGFTGDGPADMATASTSWIHGVDIPTILLGSAFTVSDAASTVDRGTNDRTVWAARPFIIEWDATVHVAVEVDQGVTPEP